MCQFWNRSGEKKEGDATQASVLMGVSCNGHFNGKWRGVTRKEGILTWSVKGTLR